MLLAHSEHFFPTAVRFLPKADFGIVLSDCYFDNTFFLNPIK